MKKLITNVSLALILITASATAQDRRYGSDPYRNNDGYHQDRNGDQHNDDRWNDDRLDNNYRYGNTDYRYGRGYEYGDRGRIIIVGPYPRPVIVFHPDWDRRDCRHRHEACDYHRHSRYDRCEHHRGCH